MSNLINEALKNEDISDLYHDREATLIGIDNYISKIDTLLEKDSYTRNTIDRYYKLKAETPKVLDKVNDQNDKLIAALCKYNISINPFRPRYVHGYVLANLSTAPDI